MILNLMRVKGMRVEDIMSHSFKELHNRRKLDEYRKELKELKGDNDKDEDQFKEMPIYDKLTAFFEDAMSFIEDWNDYSVWIFITFTSAFIIRKIVNDFMYSREQFS